MIGYTQLVEFLSGSGESIFFDNPFLGITIADTTGTVLRVNTSHSRITGTTNWVGKNFYEMVRDGFVSESSTINIIENKKEILIEQRLANEKNFLVHGYPVFDDNNELRYVVSFLLDVSELQSLKEEFERVSTRVSRLQLLKENRIIYESSQMQEIIDCVHTIANSDATVLITGESGVGKESIATLIHEASDRRDCPFIKINCNAIPDTLLESELFGYEPGTFTGGNRQGKLGLVEKADTGTIFFDEVGDMPLDLQAKLLRVLQEREVRRLGGHRNIKVDVRVIAATNADLPTMVRTKKFRQDLYYRLNVIPIYVPNLLERKEDIPALVSYFATLFNEKYRKTKEFLPCALERLMDTPLEGNIRQLRNIVERLVLLCPHESVGAADIQKVLPKDAARHGVPAETRGVAENGAESRVAAAAGAEAKVVPMKHLLKHKEAEMLRELYGQYRSSYKIAELLDMNQSTVWRKLKKYGITG